MREERNKLPIPIEWDRAYRAIEMLIENTYIPMEKEQIIDACNSQRNDYRGMPTYNKSGEQYYNETFKAK
jgi:hypothetical protein